MNAQLDSCENTIRLAEPHIQIEVNYFKGTVKLILSNFHISFSQNNHFRILEGFSSTSGVKIFQQASSNVNLSLAISRTRHSTLYMN